MFYRTDDGQGIMHVNYGRKVGPLPCAAPPRDGDDRSKGSTCGRIGGKLCDAPAGTDFAGKPRTCDMPLCAKCAVHVAPNTDYCPRHRHLAPPSLLDEA